MHITREKTVDESGDTQQRRNIAVLNITVLSAFMLMVLCLLMPSNVAHAAVFTCTLANGETAFQDRPCNIATLDSPAPGGGQAETTNTPAAYPLKMHASWFERPEVAADTAFCDEFGCSCHNQTRTFLDGMESAVLEALLLEAAWNRYTDQVRKMKLQPSRDTAAYLQLKLNAEAAACDIQMSQEVLENHAEKAIAGMRLRAVSSAEQGFNDPSKCRGDGSVACRGLKDTQAFVQVVSGLRKLRCERKFETAIHNLQVAASE